MRYGTIEVYCGSLLLTESVPLFGDMYHFTTILFQNRVSNILCLTCICLSIHYLNSFLQNVSTGGTFCFQFSNENEPLATVNSVPMLHIHREMNCKASVDL